jgi:hypothetical protein
MKQFIYKNDKVKGVIRIIGKLLYFKVNNLQYSSQVISQLESKGAKIRVSPRSSWIEANIFGDNKIVKISGKEIDLDNITNEEIEDFLYKFYLIQYTKAGFKCEGIEDARNE